MYDFFPIAQKIAIDYHIMDASKAAPDVTHAHETALFLTNNWTYLKHDCSKLVDCRLYYRIDMI